MKACGEDAGRNALAVLANARNKFWNHTTPLNSVLLHRGHLPAPSNGTGLVKCFV
jgi:hypothetical protein